VRGGCGPAQRSPVTYAYRNLITSEPVVGQRIHTNPVSEHAVFLILFASSAGGV
jgi:hypothetical protein